MAKKTAEAPTDAAPAPSVSPEDQTFELELVGRNPGRRIMRFDFPADVQDARAVYMIALKGKDLLVASQAADATMTSIEKASGKLTYEAELRESIRLSIVGLVMPDGARRHIDQSVPLAEIDDWSLGALFCLRNFHTDINGVPIEEVGKAVREARRIGGATLNQNAGQPQAATATR